MKNLTKTLCLLSLIMAGGQVSRAATLTFDDVPKWTQVGEQYASLGVHFSLTDFAVQEGLADGDNGNWGLNGTSGPYFDGFNGIPSYSMTLTFDAPVTNFRLDASRSNGSNLGDTFAISGFFGATLVDSQTITFGPINSWSTLSLSGTFDRVEWSGSGVDFHPFGIDNINFTVVPEPSTAALMAGAALAFLGPTCRRRSMGLF